MLLSPPIDEGTLTVGMFGRVIVEEGFGPDIPNFISLR
jgi:hypothetical protein